MALDVDQWFIESVLKNVFLPVPIGVVPYDKQHSKWSNDQIKHYISLWERICKAGGYVFILSESKNWNVTPGTKEYSNKVRQCLLSRNEAMIDCLVDREFGNNGVLFSVWDDQHDGGTYAAVKYAMKHGVRVYSYNPLTDYGRWLK